MGESLFSVPTSPAQPVHLVLQNQAFKYVSNNQYRGKEPPSRRIIAFAAVGKKRPPDEAFLARALQPLLDGVTLSTDSSYLNLSLIAFAAVGKKRPPDETILALALQPLLDRITLSTDSLHVRKLIQLCVCMHKRVRSSSLFQLLIHTMKFHTSPQT